MFHKHTKLDDDDDDDDAYYEAFEQAIQTYRIMKFQDLFFAFISFFPLTSAKEVKKEKKASSN
jgi:hypothetical protein